MTKAAKVLPLRAGADLIPGYDQYLPTITGDIRARASMWWSFGGVIRSAQVQKVNGQGGELIKLWSSWAGTAGPEEIEAHAQEVRETCGTRCVSGYGGAVRASLGNLLPIESRTHTWPYLELVRGGWQQALKPGAHAGVWHHYDLRSAYYAALLAGLPDPKSYRVTRVLGPNGVYRVKLKKGSSRVGLPYPFDLESEVLASWEEIGTYGLEVEEVVTGVQWTKDYNVAPIVYACDRWSFAKRARRCFWGTWASDQAVKCHSRSGSEWSPLAARPHPVWSHLILSRVRLKLWEATARACHVFVDSVITRDKLRTGDGPGDWRLVTTYGSGVRIGGPGQYGPLGEVWERYAGVPIGDPRRAAA